MSVKDAKNAVKIGASAIMISNHGGRQLDGSRSPFDQLKEILMQWVEILKLFVMEVLEEEPIF